VGAARYGRVPDSAAGAFRSQRGGRFRNEAELKSRTTLTASSPGSPPTGGDVNGEFGQKTQAACQHFQEIKMPG
jgi:hypothetical protein